MAVVPREPGAAGPQRASPGHDDLVPWEPGAAGPQGPALGTMTRCAWDPGLRCSYNGP